MQNSACVPACSAPCRCRITSELMDSVQLSACRLETSQLCIVAHANVHPLSMQQLRHLFKSKSAKHTLTKLGVTLQVSEWLSNYSGLEELLLSITVTILAVVAFGPLCSLFGGALFNPVHNAAFIMAGKGSFKFNAARMVSLAVCGVAGSSAQLVVA